ncbi:FxsB family cyclophane-forming radical SAM/SPASM peptide maturase [Actinomadura sp. HBU206391]|uniref:FxsB family cyclophane-forming radical SAM/SPASM peptide maturase n=1 Tax=Actinomadura sp. HBU206391 TaxID=2731692 RepID=UPI0016509D5C|nr:FxsB family cyclophane-forming radical SAM/SPASM peptide maturase [Actinomadura sp. HBU206391]MBC6459332.1 FxsB family radical SAM/SPASM domain protein [Actinomadura sp. HBU206391]
MADSEPLPGWAPQPFRQFVFKVQSRCNLDCDYCYVYHLADQSWRRQPKHMAPDTVRAAARRIAEHAARHELDRVKITIHGGEPLLGGRAYLETFLSVMRANAPGVALDFSMQTNGVLLDDEMAAFLVDESVIVGISLDGDREANDLHRRFRDGRSSYDLVEDAIRRMTRPENRESFGGVLCTVQLAADPLRVWHSLLDLGTPALDFLLPHGTWSSPPPGLRPGDGRTPYADWLIPIFDEWFDAADRPASVRIFEDILNLLLGGVDSYESFGLAPVCLVVVETDGGYEQVDSMKAAYEGAAATGMSVFTESLDDLLGTPGIVARQVGLSGLHETCRECALVETCGGGLYSHRYLEGSGFVNPSVFCADLYALISHIERRTTDQLTARGLTLAQVRQSGPSAGGEGLADGRGTSGNGAARTLGGA